MCPHLPLPLAIFLPSSSQVAGLKSITAKHLALSCQALGFFISLQPHLLAALSAGMAEHRKALLAPEMSRLLADLTVHRDEIYTKLVAIMRERLLAGARQLPQSASKWGEAAEGKQPRKPTAFAESTAKQLRVLRGVLMPLLNEADLSVLFGRISVLFGTTVAETYGRLEPQGDTAAWEAQRKADTMLLLQVGPDKSCTWIVVICFSKREGEREREREREMHIWTPPLPPPLPPRPFLFCLPPLTVPSDL